jgi:CBS domain-containing protein/sporulation protein YlmC with PRC-barrel domain
MTSQTTFYASQIIGSVIYDIHNSKIGNVKDLFINAIADPNSSADDFRPQVIGVKTTVKGQPKILDYNHITITNKGRTFKLVCSELKDAEESISSNGILIGKHILDQQIVDFNGRKLVRVNDIRLVSVASGTYALAVDIGTEGLLRRLGISNTVNTLLKPFGTSLPTEFILWDDVQAFDSTNFNIKLSRSSNKLNTLHPSDLADIIEDMGAASRQKLFESLDEEHAADVLEEMEPYAQAQIIENMSIDKAADVLEKMPADEVADLMDILEDEKVELLLNEMEKETSEEVRGLLEYEDNEVGSLMTTDYISFRETSTVEETLVELRTQKPKADEIYSLFVTDQAEVLLGTVSLRDLVVSMPDKTLAEIMHRKYVSVYDEEKINSLSSIISKYDLLAIPVVNRERVMMGMVVIDDIVDDLIDKGKTKKGGRAWH